MFLLKQTISLAVFLLVPVLLTLSALPSPRHPPLDLQTLFSLCIVLSLVLVMVHPPTSKSVHLDMCANTVIVSGWVEAY